MKYSALLNPFDCHFLSQKNEIQIPHHTQISQDIELDDAIYNLVMSADQKTLLVGTRQTMNLFDLQNGLHLTATFSPHNVTWTMTDCDISDDSTIGVSCSLNPYVSLYDLKQSKVLAHFNLRWNNQTNPDWTGYYGVKIYTCKLSSDKTTLIAGTGRSGDCASAYFIILSQETLILQYDILKNKLIHSIQAHNNDINSIAYLQRNQTQVFVSGSDDSFLKVWDTRTLGLFLFCTEQLGLTGKPVGLFYGHFAGVTHVDSKNDGIYICSNSKDQVFLYQSMIQSLKLWDLRQLSTDENLPHKYLNFDYRYGKPEQSIINDYRKQSQSANIHYDTSVSSFTCHYIVQTLIRCHFSPLETTGRRFLMTASSCGKVFIYSIDNPSEPPRVINPKQNSFTSNLELDQDELLTEESNWESYGSEDNQNDENLCIIRDVNWNDNSMIIGDFNGIMKEFKLT